MDWLRRLSVSSESIYQIEELRWLARIGDILPIALAQPERARIAGGVMDSPNTHWCILPDAR
jgi:hypothetical protein